MTRRNRVTLRSFFEPGLRPSRDHFADLIDSALIMDDEGFSKTPSDGLKVVTTKDELGLISFQRQLSSRVNWSMAFLDHAGRQLALKPSSVKDPSVPPMVTFLASEKDAGLNVGGDDDAPTGREPGEVRINANVRIGADAPAFKLDVAGTVSADGRIGRECTPLRADGVSHPITPVLSGCVAFEVMAAVSGPKSRGRFALLHAIAMNAYNPIWWDDVFGLRRRIRSQHAYYSRRSDRLQLSWEKTEDRKRDPNDVHGMDAKFTLNIRTRSTYLDDDPNIRIQAYVTRLWPPSGPAAQRASDAGE
jgi:hypothetical protein